MATITIHAPLRVALWTWIGAALGRRRRAALADGFVHAVAVAQRPPIGLTSAVPVQREAVLESRAALLELAQRIRATDGTHPERLVPARWLLTDGGGPLYMPAPPGALREAVAEAILALGDVRADSP